MNAPTLIVDAMMVASTSNSVGGPVLLFVFPVDSVKQFPFLGNRRPCWN